jgi:hypothetical protein|tara:strand:- start:125 stop:313 length:189 start_codon:yes stop_codon:yes gene_type:complete
MEAKRTEIKQDDSKITIFDLDNDDEIMFKLEDIDNRKMTFWLRKENLIDLKKHIDYIYDYSK